MKGGSWDVVSLGGEIMWKGEEWTRDGYLGCSAHFHFV